MPDSIEELQQRLAETRDPIEKIDAMIAISDAMRRTNPEEALKFARKAMRLAAARKDSARLAASRVSVAFCEYYQSDFLTAAKHFRAVLPACREVGDALLTARALQGIGVSCTGTGEYVAAMAALNEALELV